MAVTVMLTLKSARCISSRLFDRRISVGGSTSFSFDAFYWKGVEDGLTYEVQYRDASGNWVAVGSDSTLFPSSKYKISYVTKTDDNDAFGRRCLVSVRFLGS